MQACLSLCWSHIQHCWKSHVAAIFYIISPSGHFVQQTGAIFGNIDSGHYKEIFGGCLYLGLRFRQNMYMLLGHLCFITLFVNFVLRFRTRCLKIFFPF